MWAWVLHRAEPTVVLHRHGSGDESLKPILNHDKPILDHAVIFTRGEESNDLHFSKSFLAVLKAPALTRAA